MIGDSFVEGEGATAEQGWAQQLAQKFEESRVSGAGGDDVNGVPRIGGQLDLSTEAGGTPGNLGLGSRLWSR